MQMGIIQQVHRTHNMILCAQTGVREGRSHCCSAMRRGASTAASRQHFSALIRSDREESEPSMPAVWDSHLKLVKLCMTTHFKAWIWTRVVVISDEACATLRQITVCCRQPRLVWHLAHRHRLSTSSRLFIDGFQCDCCVTLANGASVCCAPGSGLNARTRADHG